MKPFCLFLLLSFLSFSMKGQQVYLKHYTVDDGLPSNETYQVMEDAKGNLLIATDRAAVQFDGYSFEDVPLQRRFNSKPVYYIYQTAENKIYFSSLQGALYEYRNDTLSEYAYYNKAATLFNHPGILIANSISQHKDTMWISYNNDYNYNYKVGSCFITKEGKVQRLNKPDGIYFDLARNFYYRQLSAANYNTEKQPVYITWKDGQLSKDTIQLSWRGGYIRRLFYEQLGDHHLFCIGRKLLVYQNGQKKGEFLLPENVLCLTKISATEFCIGFENKGASRYQLKDGLVSAPSETVLPGYSVTSIYKDRQEGTWFSTMENGLFYSYPSNVHYWDNNSKIVSITRRKDKAFIAYHSGLVEILKENKKQREIWVPLPKGSYLSRLSFTNEDSLIGITEKGYYLQQKGSWKFFPSQEAFLLAAKSNLLYGASASSPELHIYKAVGEPVYEKQQLTKRIISLFADSRQKLWIGTWEGLLKYENNRLIDHSNQHAVYKDRIVAIDELPGNHLVVASLGNGIVVSKDKQFYTLNTSNGLHSPIINSMAVDGNHIWLGTNRGLVKATFLNGRFTVVHYGVESGLPTGDIHQFTVKNGWVYIKWVNRLVVANDNRLSKPVSPKQTFLSSVIINDKETANKKNPLLLHHQNTLSFVYSAPNLSAAGQQEYLYTLEGFDKRWFRTRERFTKYTNLPPGKYIFKVKAASLRDGVPTGVAVYAFTIKPAFWQTWWFISLLAVTTILLIALFFQKRINAIHKKNDLLLELAENRAKVLVQLIHPHFVFNVLNTIQGAVLKQDKMQAATLVSKFAKLMRLSMELGKAKMVLLADEIELLKRYFELEAIRSPGRFTYSIETAPLLDPASVLIPSMLIQPFVENAIKHGIMHLEDRQGYIHIFFQKKEGALICIVDDNGVGREQAEQINQIKRENHQSSGIDITINRLELVHKEKRSSFLYKVEDKEDEKGRPAGTKVVFSIPYNHTHETDTHINRR